MIILEIKLIRSRKNYFIINYPKKLENNKNQKYKITFKDHPAVGPRPLKPLTGVRISVPEPNHFFITFYVKI